LDDKVDWNERKGNVRRIRRIGLKERGMESDVRIKN
jgi:hypothetical protein